VKVKFRTIHTKIKYQWRKSYNHETLKNATDGNDGATRLLRKIGRRARLKWENYGAVLCIFVWDDETETGCAYRLRSGSSSEIETASLPSHQLEQYDSANGCSESELAGFSWSPISLPPLATSPSLILPVATTDALRDLPVAVDPIDPNYPDELPASATYPEGLARSILINEYERSKAARCDCIQHYKPICQVCRVNFEERYGEIGHGFIHVHHIQPVSSVGASYRIDPIKDLRPVCPNCHAMLHRHEPPMSIEALRALFNFG
jgi:5-methylcytosine-specific restriction protein A